MIDEIVEVARFILGFLPWIMFLFLPTDGWDPLRRSVVLCLAASVLFAWKVLRKGFILQWATVVFFGFCTISLYGFRWVWLAQHMEIIANSFLAGVIWFTVLVGKPFTLQYARADLPLERWYDEGLIRSCRFIAIFWGILLLIPTAFSAFRLFCPAALSDRFYFCLSLCSITTGIMYTSFYKRMKRKQREAQH
jgi:carotenoid cleavage dioxygenase